MSCIHIRAEFRAAYTRSRPSASGTVRMTTTHVLALGKMVIEGGKSAKSRRQLALDRYTVEVLEEHLRKVEQERSDWDSGYRDRRLVFCWEDGRPIYPDTITEQFNKLVDHAGLPRTRLHDTRHSYATIALRSGVHRDLDSQAAETIGGLFLPPLEDPST